jgi:transposase
MYKPQRLLKKISKEAQHIKDYHTAKYKKFNLYCMDESRFGLLTISHKALTIKGVKPIAAYQHKFETTYLFGAFSPINGAHLLLEMPYCNSNTFQAFLDEFSLLDKDEFKIMIVDNGAFHKARSLKIPANIALVFLPPYSPELNPAEKVWWIIKRELKNRCHKTMDDLQKAITEAIEKTISTDSIKKLCAYAYYTAINL